MADGADGKGKRPMKERLNGLIRNVAGGIVTAFAERSARAVPRAFAAQARAAVEAARPRFVEAAVAGAEAEVAALVEDWRGAALEEARCPPGRCRNDEVEDAIEAARKRDAPDHEAERREGEDDLRPPEALVKS